MYAYACMGQDEQSLCPVRTLDHLAQYCYELGGGGGSVGLAGILGPFQFLGSCIPSLPNQIPLPTSFGWLVKDENDSQGGQV